MATAAGPDSNASDSNASACTDASCRPPAATERPYSPAAAALIAAATSCLSLLTVTGNLLVLLSVPVNRRLWTVHNYFLLSLAAADLLVGLVSVNLYALYLLWGSWPLPAALCDVWLVADHVVSGASVLSLLLISLDRYLCLTRPCSYPARRGGGAALLMIGAAWLLASACWAPAILCWQTEGGRRVVPEDRCYTQLLASPAVVLATTLPTFYLPAVAMVTLYCRLSAASRARLNAYLLERGGASTGRRVSGSRAAAEDAREGAGDRRSGFKPPERRQRRAIARERRVTRTVLAIVLAFVVTWTPYNVLAVVAAFGHVVIPDALWTTGYWLRYLNSALNPCCYALCSATFRRTFGSLLRCRGGRLQRRLLPPDPASRPLAQGAL